MKNRSFTIACAPVLLSLLLITCKKPEPEPAPDITSKKVSYEITGTYSGKLTVTYINAYGMKESQTRISLPWSKFITAAEKVTQVEFTAATAEIDDRGKHSEYAVATLYINGNPQVSERQNTDADGKIRFNRMVHTY